MGKKRNLLLIIIPVIAICFVVIGITYAFYTATKTVEDKIVGNSARPDIAVSVEEITKRDSLLIPMSEELIIKAINHDPKCIDDNGNEVCDVYKITVINTGGASLYTTGDITLVGNTLPNLKWKEISSPTSIKEGATPNGLGSSNLFFNDVLHIGSSNIYYIIVYINETGSNQTDKGDFNGTVTVNGMTTEFKGPEPVVEKISNLYINAPKAQVTNNSITYNYANIYDTDSDDTTSGGLIDDKMIDEAGNIRYYGANPNNYIYFNCSDYTNQSADTCELWRIIGLFKDITLGDGTKKDLIKIIRNDPIGEYSWDNKDTSTGAESDYGKNDWTTARLMKLLNPSDYYTVDPNDKGYGQSLYWNGDSGTCFSGENNATTPCDFTLTGIKNNATRNRISEVTWNLGGSNNTGTYPNQMYSYERGTDVYKGRPTTWIGKVGLMYLSDYGYGTDFSKCSQQLFYYSDDICSSNDWLFNGANQWLLTPNLWEYPVWGVFPDGIINDYARYDNGVRPALYLSSEQVIEAGDGSSGSPYKLGA